MGNVQSVVPYEAQLNKINVELACSVSGESYPPGIANLTLSVTAPLYGGAGQDIYFSDLAGSFDITAVPEDGQNTFPKWDLTLFVNTSISNASPAQGAPILQTIGQNSTDGHFVFPGPQANGPLPPLGPFTLGDAGQISELTLDVITARLDFITRANSVRVSSFWNCGPAQPPYIISSVPITTSDGPSAPSTGSPGSLPDIAVGSKYTQGSMRLACSTIDSDETSLSVNFTIAGTSPASVQAGSNFTIQDVETFLTIPGSLASALDSFYGSDPPYGPKYALVVGLGRSFDGRDIGKGLQLTFANGSPATDDIARNFVTTYPNTPNPLYSMRFVQEGDANPQPFPLPQVGTITIGNYTAGEAGTVFSVNDIGSTFTFAGYANNGMLCGYISYVCVARPVVDLFSIPIY